MKVDGRWVGSDETHVVQIRIDLDGLDHLGVISGDLYKGGGEPDGDHATWECSFVSELVEKRPIGALGVEITCPLSFFGRSDLYGEIVLQIWGPAVGRPEERATFELIVASHRKIGAVRTVSGPLERRSPYFRTVRVKVATAEGLELPGPHTLGTAPPCPTDLPSRDLSIETAYTDAGIELVVEGEETLKVAARLDDADLHAILANAAKDEPKRGWWVHFLIAHQHAWNGVLGVLYDSEHAHPRHGVVVFLGALRQYATSEEELEREFLYTGVHELGHSFNLLHSFQKGYFGGSDVAPRPGSASWMNYPHLYPYGRWVEPDQPDRFWADFRFRFDREELIHLRHHERDEVMMGAESFGVLGDRVAARLDGPAVVELGEPFALALVVSNRSASPRQIALPPDMADAVDLAIRRPDGAWARFEPLISRRALATVIDLAPGETRRFPIAAFYGRHGFSFAEVGTHVVRGAARLGGDTLAIGPLPICVQAPPRGIEQKLVDAVFGDEQGHYLSFWGGEHLARGRASLAALVEDPRLGRTRAARRVRPVLAAGLARGGRLDEALKLAGARPGDTLRELVGLLKMNDAPPSVLQRFSGEEET